MPRTALALNKVSLLVCETQKRRRIKNVTRLARVASNTFLLLRPGSLSSLSSLGYSLDYSTTVDYYEAVCSSSRAGMRDLQNVRDLGGGLPHEPHPLSVLSGGYLRSNTFSAQEGRRCRVKALALPANPSGTFQACDLENILSSLQATPQEGVLVRAAGASRVQPGTRSRPSWQRLRRHVCQLQLLPHRLGPREV